MRTREFQLSMLFIHVVIELLLRPPICLRYLGIEGVNVITVFALDIAPLCRHVVVLAVQRFLGLDDADGSSSSAAGVL